MTFLKSLNIFILFLGLSTVAQSQKLGLDETDTQANVKASYLFQISKYTDWPDETKQGPFTIAVIGDPSLFNILRDKYANKPIGSQLLQIAFAEKVSELPSSVQIVYVSDEKDIAECLKVSKKKPMLITTEFDQALDKGVNINFVKQDGIIRFELNDSQSQKKGILFSDKLKGWATKLK
jgi:hypothetical protein